MSALRDQPQAFYSPMRQASAAVALVVATTACGSSSPTAPQLPPRPVPLSPVAGVQATTDKPPLTVQNAQGFDSGQATYTFHIFNQDGTKELATVTAPAGREMTQAVPAASLPRGHILTWNVTATNGTGSVSSDTATFRSAVVPCLTGRDPYAKSVVDWFLPACSLAHNIYNDPREVLGPPDAGGTAPDHFFGFMSLGEKGYVTVDMEACAADQPGPDVRVFQSVSKEPVSLYASGSP